MGGGLDKYLKLCYNQVRKLKRENNGGFKVKIKRFVKEYANHKINIISNNELMKQDIKEEKLQDIEKYIKSLKRGLITVDECIHQINKI